MLVIHTNYDQVTAILSRIATEFIGRAGTHVAEAVAPNDADALSIQKRLAARTTDPVLFFGHGANHPLALVAQDRKPAMDVHIDGLLVDRLICATACYSAEILEDSARNHNATILGYRGEVRIPLKGYQAEFERSVLAGPQALLAGMSADCAEQEARVAFQREAANLMTGSTTDQVFAILIFDNNALAVSLEGNPHRTMQARFA